jgi:DNA-binding NtrC family response regulator
MAKKRVLICDDERAVRETLKYMLADAYELYLTHDGEEALRCIQSAAIDLVILDIKMPKMNGLEVLRRIRHLRPEIPVVMITGYESTDVATEAIHLGANDYITKPFDSQRIRSALKRLMAES